MSRHPFARLRRTDLPPPRRRDRSRPFGLLSLLATLARAAEDRETVRTRDMLAALGPASVIAPILLPALIVVSPLSGIPMLSSVCGLAIAALAAQLLFGRKSLWLPGWLLDRSLPTRRYLAALTWLKRPGAFVDRVTSARLEVLVTPPVAKVMLLVCMLAGLAMPLLELLPFTSSILATGITLIALGLIVRDGISALLGVAFIGAAIALIAWLTMAVAAAT